ncbi:MAG: PspC domain-containing protein [Candidatus Marinimicrobia bacterium]|nr:PspC domain-containing protein [Candidatus Neomarinimicrobiota bacterium]
MATCGACQGSKTQSCPKCMGRGYVSRLTSSGDIDTKPCWVCGGRREIRCQLCKGTGKVESEPKHEPAVIQPDLSGFKPARSFRRSSTDRIIAGVLGGLADYFLVNSTMLRWVFVAVTIFTMVIPTIVIYLVLWVFLPEAKSSHSASARG